MNHPPPLTCRISDPPPPLRINRRKRRSLSGNLVRKSVIGRTCITRIDCDTIVDGTTISDVRLEISPCLKGSGERVWNGRGKGATWGRYLLRGHVYRVRGGVRGRVSETLKMQNIKSPVLFRVLTGVVGDGRGGSEPVGVGRGTPETEPDVHRSGERGAPARAVVRAQHPPVAQPDRQVHGRAEPDAIPAKVPEARVQERAVLVQEPQGQVQEAQDVPVRRHVAEGSVSHAHVPQSRLTDENLMKIPAKQKTKTKDERKICENTNNNNDRKYRIKKKHININYDNNY